MPMFSIWSGHFVSLKKSIQTLPENTTLHTVMLQLSKGFPKGIFYINLWPFSGTWMVLATPSTAAQALSLNLDKPMILRRPLETINGGPSLITMQGDVWKRWRSLLNPGFNPVYLTQLAPIIAEEIAVFCGLLQVRAGQDSVFQLESMTLRLTMDIIGSVALETRLRSQTQDSLLASALQRQIEWTSFGTQFNPFKRYLTIRPFVLWYNNRRMNRFIGEEIDRRFSEIREQGQKNRASKSVVSLILAQYLKDEHQEGTAASFKSFKKGVTPQLRGFLFAGRDTTSSTLCYCYYLLARNQAALCRAREEHDAVFGADSSRVREIIAQDPQRLEHLPYTTAVIKEALRLFPPAASLRQGRPGVDIIDEEGRQHPTDGSYVWALTVAVHRNPACWKNAELFIPERWLAGQDDPLRPAKGAWRAFGTGPKGCIGQALAMLQLRIALVMTLRDFEIAPAYDEWDRMYPKTGIRLVDGHRAYQAEKGGGGAHPADGFPCKVALRT